MFKYTFKIFLRNLSRRKLFSLINISGLAFGVAFVLLIGQYLFFEASYNKEIRNVENIYRLVDSASNDYNLDYRIKDEILSGVPGVKNACLLNHFSFDINAENKLWEIKHALFVDPAFFKMFNISFISGNPESALSSVDNVVLTETTAKNIFGTTDVVGKTLQAGHQYDLIIKGVVKDLYKNVSFSTEIFLSSENCYQQRISYKQECSRYVNNDDSQCKYPFNVFIELENSANTSLVEKQISSFNKINSNRYPSVVKLEPMKTNYFNTAIQESDLMHGNAELVKILSIIGIVILLLAVINFINLATAAYKYRLTEIGIKKCLGLNRKGLIKQLLIETFFTCVISSLFGIILSEIFLPYFNKFIDKDISLQIFTNREFLLLFLGFILTLSIIAGIFPALIISRISPLQLFKFNSYIKGSGWIYRNVLTMVQFSLTIILISGLIVIDKQIDYVKHKNLGFNTDHLLYMKIPYTLGHRIQVLKNKLQDYHGTQLITSTMSIPGRMNMIVGGYPTIIIDSTSLKTFGFKIIKGRDILPGDFNKACLINEAAFNQLGSGYKTAKINGSEIVGVVSDFHYSSLHTKTGPLILLFAPWGADHLTIRASGQAGEIINYINKTWNEVCPDYPMDYGFYDEYFALMYRKEENFASLVNIFSILAVVISCMGIFGLSVFQTEQRMKEIGIRKVFGATTFEIVKLLSGNFSMWVILANIIAWPAAFYLMNKWLEDFAYRIEISWWMFALAGLIALLIAVVTISFQTVKAALANPVESLKYE